MRPVGCEIEIGHEKEHFAGRAKAEAKMTKGMTVAGRMVADHSMPSARCKALGSSFHCNRRRDGRFGTDIADPRRKTGVRRLERVLLTPLGGDEDPRHVVPFP
jgi:hypothetical protein